MLHQPRSCRDDIEICHKNLSHRYVTKIYHKHSFNGGSLDRQKEKTVGFFINSLFGFFVISDLANKSPDFSSSIQFFTGGFRLDSGLFSSSLSGLSAPVPLFEWERRDQREDCWRLALSILFLRCRQKSDPS